MKKSLLLLAAIIVAATASATDIITDTPAGKLYPQVYGASARSYLTAQGGFGSIADNAGYCTSIVVNGNDIYVRNIIREYPGMNSWVKGTVRADGKVEFAFPQPVATDGANGATLYAAMMKPQSSGASVTLVSDTDNPNLIMTWDGTHLNQVLPGTATGDLARFDGMIGLVTADGTFSSYGETDVRYTIWETLPEVPAEGLGTKEYNATYTDEWNDSKKQLVRIGFEGNTAWIQGLCTQLPQAWIKGSLASDGSITIASRQFLGIANDYFYFFFGAENSAGVAGKEYSWLESTRLTAATTEAGTTYTATTPMMMNLGNTRPWFGSGISNLVLAEMVKGDPVPVNPVFGEPEWDESDGMGVADFYINPQDVNGNPLETSNLYYRVFFNGALVTDLYTGQGITPGDIPYGKSSDLILFEYDWHFVIFLEALETIGVQVVYKDGTKEYLSDLVTFNFPGSVGGIIADKAPVARTEYFTLTGTRMERPSGMCIRRIVRADGSVEVSKIIRK